MANQDLLALLKKGAVRWNHWREIDNQSLIDLSGADLGGMKLNTFNLLRANLTNANLEKAQFEHAHLTDANLTGSVLTNANFEHSNARNAIFDRVAADGTNFEVATLRRASFAKAKLSGARFHRAYLRDTELSDAILTNAWLRFANLDGARCVRTDFSDADLRHASLVKTNLKGAKLVGVQVFGISAWSVQTDVDTRQDLIVDVREGSSRAPLRAHDLQTAQLLALMLDGNGVRSFLNSVSSKLVLILGSFLPEDKQILDALRDRLKSHGYLAVTFDFVRPLERDYAETVVVLAGLSRFVIADFTNAKEVRAEITQIKSQYRRVPIIPLGRKGASLPITMVNSFSPEELGLLVRYENIDDLMMVLDTKIIEPAERSADLIAASIAKAESILRAGLPSGS
jgi:uncharacterized protein YjbI with pentapeptide repeats